MNVTRVIIKPKIRIIQVDIQSPSMEELGMNVGMNVTSVNGKFT